jgi:hypothetical protein
VTRGNAGNEHRKIEFMDDSENDMEADRRNEDSIAVQEKVKKLLDEVCKQQTVISQTSQALNLCAATIEFSGSTESVEGERHLLVASKYFLFLHGLFILMRLLYSQPSTSLFGLGTTATGRGMHSTEWFTKGEGSSL